jgi:molybdopterin-synthase adenylyltransferase
LTGVIGAMQAMEAIKLAAAIGESLDGRLMIFDAKGADWRTVRVKKDAACSVCRSRTAPGREA